MREPPLILFGAFDRHNFGDLLLARVAAQRAAREFPGRLLLYAGVAARDLTPWGGFATQALSRLPQDLDKVPAEVLHVGGELLGCSLYEAAIMVLSPRAANQAIARYDRDPVARQAWAEAQLGLRQQLAYLVPKDLFQRSGRFVHRSLGGVDLDRLPEPMQAEVRNRLAESDALSVRDHITRSWLAARGIRADLEPDPGESVARLFAADIRRHGLRGEPARVMQAFPQGYVALQFSGDFADDATLDQLAAAFSPFLAHTGLGLVPFRAGAAPWHDDLAVYRRLLTRLQPRPSHLFVSLHLWDICALLAGARLFLGSSLHARMVARAFGVPGISLTWLAAPGKVQAYAWSWWRGTDEGVGDPVTVDGLAPALLDAAARITAVTAPATPPPAP